MKFCKLRAKMIEKGMNQGELAMALKIAPQTLNAKINGRTQFNLEELIKMTAILGIKNPVDVFFEENS
ncbi:MAG: helix-turn-helix transcriptional regulator [Dorea sp.]|nr:helix-turn-helix transcriptional regulator [uncultured Dorea sp.]